MSQMFFTARELADIAAKRGLTSFPNTERGVQIHAARESWNDLPANLCRKRSGREGGGGREYHLTVLPESLQNILHGDAIKAATIAGHHVQKQVATHKITAAGVIGLSGAARAVMEARAEVLVSIEGYAFSCGESRAWGIAQFLAAQTAWSARQEIEARRDRSEILTSREVESLTRALILTAARGFHLSPARLIAANDRNSSPVVKRSTLYAWFKARDAGSVIALAPGVTNHRDPILAGFGDFLRHYAKPSKPSVTDAFKAYAAGSAARSGVQHLTLTEDQCRYILRKRMNNIEKNVGREGLLTLRSRLAYVTRTTEDMWPTTIYTADGKTFDAEIADPVTKGPIRPEITTVLDVVTRKIVGISLARSENQRSVAEALRNSCSGWGIPAIFYTDRGPGYRNDAMDADVGGLMGRLHITKMHAAPYGSQAKGRIERPNATVWDVLAKRLPTYIGADMDKEAGQKIHKITRRELKEFGQSRNLPSWEEFVQLCDARVAEYNAAEHRGLARITDPQTGRARHMSPNEAWDAHVANGFEPVPVDPDEADDLFRPYEIRTAGRSQVKWNNNLFFHEALETHHGERVMVGYDYHQANRVWVREFDRDNGQPGRLICVAVFMGNAARYVPLSYEMAAVEDRAKGRLKRVDAKRDAIEAERDAQFLIEHQAGEVMPFLDVTSGAEPQPITLAIDNTPDAGGAPFTPPAAGSLHQMKSLRSGL